MKSVFWSVLVLFWYHFLHSPCLMEKPHQQNGVRGFFFCINAEGLGKLPQKKQLKKTWVISMKHSNRCHELCLCRFCCWCGVGVRKFTGCFAFMIASWPPAGLWECFTPFILHRSTCIMSFEGDSVYSILFRKKSYHNMMWQGALCENLTSFCCKG